jgi:hypothetical protein
MAQLIPRNDIGEIIGQNLGTGLSQGINSGVNILLQQKLGQLAQQNERARIDQLLSSPNINPELASVLRLIPQDQWGKAITESLSYGISPTIDTSANQQQDQIIEKLKSLGITEPSVSLPGGAPQTTPTAIPSATPASAKKVITPQVRPTSYAEAARQGKRITPQEQRKIDLAEAGLDLRREAATQRGTHHADVQAQQRSTALGNQIQETQKTGIPAARILQTANEMKKLFNTKKIKFADLINNRLNPEEIKDPDTQYMGKLINQLVLQMSQADVKGVKSNYLTRLVESGKPGLQLKPQAFINALNEVLYDPEIHKQAARYIASEDKLKQWGGNVPASWQSDIAKDVDRLVKDKSFVKKFEVEKPTQQSVTFSQLSPQNITPGKRFLNPDTGKVEVWNGKEMVPEEQYAKESAGKK